MKNISLKLLSAILVIFLFASCNSEDELGPSIFDTTDNGIDPTSYTAAFDSYLYENYTVPYNLEFMYKMKDVETDMNYNLIPASLEKSMDMAVLMKYLWFDVYKKLAGETFLKLYSPRMILLIGSPEYNPASGTMILGEAEGGIKIFLTRVNYLDTSNPESMNEFYFHTMHHEFMHILHQTKPYPNDFIKISSAYYNPLTWNKTTDLDANSLGFVTPYATSAVQEDWVETISIYVTDNDSQWAARLTNASVSNSHGVDGKTTILTKLEKCRKWMKNEWNIDLDSLRTEVQYRENHINMDSLLSEIK